MTYSRTLNRGTAALGQFSRVAKHLSYDQENLVKVDGGTTINALIDPDSFVWDETPGGGREVIEKVAFTRQQGLLDVGDQVTSDGKTWKVVDYERERIYGTVMGDNFTLQRLFGG